MILLSLYFFTTLFDCQRQSLLVNYKTKPHESVKLIWPSNQCNSSFSSCFLFTCAIVQCIHFIFQFKLIYGIAMEMKVLVNWLVQFGLSLIYSTLVENAANSIYIDICSIQFHCKLVGKSMPSILVFFWCDKMCFVFLFRILHCSVSQTM